MTGLRVPSIVLGIERIDKHQNIYLTLLLFCLTLGLVLWYSDSLFQSQRITVFQWGFQMNQPTKFVLAFGIVLLVLGLAIGSIASAASELEPMVFRSNVSAFQVPIVYTLTVNVVGGGSVTKNPQKPLNQYAPGDSVQLTGVPSDASWTFSGWSGDLGGSANPATIVMTPTSKVVTATFTQATCYNLNVISANGSVIRNLSPNCAVTQYITGSSITLTASANPGFSFNNWTGCNASTGAVCNVVMSSDKTVTANYLTCNRLTKIGRAACRERV
jgi:hypothetical protein